MRIYRFLCITAALAFVGTFVGTVAGAQTPSSPSDYVSCPLGRLSIYFSSGETTTSPQAVVLIDRISETAATCQPDGIDLLARIDARVDGERAMSLAMARLSAVAEDLIAKGVPVERIRVAAQASSSQQAPNLNQIDVLFRKAAEVIDDVAAPPPVVIRKVPSPAI